MEEKLIIAVAGFPVIYDVPQTQQLDYPSWCEFDKKARNTIYKGHFPARMFVFQREFNSFAQNNTEASKCLL